MIYLASKAGERPARKHEIAKSEALSADYVEQICIKLKAANLILSHRGVNGGFSMVGDPATVTVADVLEAMDGPISLAPCAANDCARASVCVTRNLWQLASEALIDVFKRATIKDLSQQAKTLESSRAIVFDI